MRTLNVRLAVILLAIIIVGGAAIGVIHYLQQMRNAGFFLEQAELAKQELEDARKNKNTEDQAKARDKQLRNLVWYLSFKPDDLDVLEQMGMAQAERVNDVIQSDGILDTKLLREAYTSLDKVVREDYTRNAARRKLIDLLMRGGRFADAREHINILLKTSQDDPELWQLLGQSEEAVHEFEKAQAAYEKAIEYSPAQVDSYVRLAAVLRGGLEKQKEADDYMKKMIENNPKSAKAYISLGAYLQTYVVKEIGGAASGKKYEPIYFTQCTDAKDETMKAAEKALEISPGDTDALSLASRSAMLLGDMEKARKYAEQNMELHKDAPMVYINLAEILLLSKEPDKKKALEILDRGLKETDNDARVLWFKASFLVDDRNIDAAKEIVQKLESKQFQKPLIDYIQARISFAQRDWADAARRFEAVRPFLASYPRYLLQADVSLGYSYGQLHNVDQQIASYKRVLAVDPFYAPARQGLTDALLAAGRIDDAVGEYATLIRMGKMPASGLMAFASVLIRQNMQQDAKDQKWDQVQKVLDEAEKANPDAPQIVLLRTEVLHAQNRDADAEKLLQNAHQKNPKELQYWNALVTIAALQKKWNQAEKVLADYEQQMGDSPELRLARAEYLLNRYENKVAEYLKPLGDKVDAFSEADKIRLWNGLLTTARRSGDNALVKHYVDLLAQKDVNNLEVHFLRLEQAANNQDVAALENALKDIEKVEGEGQPLGLFGHARLLVLRAKGDPGSPLLDDAIQDLMQARELRGSWSRIPLFLGTIYDQQNKPDRALKSYLEAINMGEHNPGVVRRAVQLLFQNRRYADADKLLKQLDRLQTPFTPELTKLWVQLLIQQGEFDLAVSKARQAVSEKSDDYNEHLWLGQILGIAARRAKSQNRAQEYQDLAAEAEKNLRRAVELKGDAAETWVALVEFLSSTDKTSEAEELINKASAKIPADQAAVALAQCYEAVDKNDQALEQYKLALAAKPDDQLVVRNVADFYQRIGKTVEAEALLNRIIQGKVKADLSNLAWARRQLAQIIAAKGGMMNMEAARKLIEENIAMGANSADDLRIKYQFYAVDPRLSMKEQAIATLQKMMEGQQATPEDRYNLAVLYLSIEKQLNPLGLADSKADGADRNTSAWIKAGNILRNLIASENVDPRYLALYAKALLDHGETAGAELYLNRLVKDFSNAAATVILQSEFLTRRNQYEEALDMIKSFVDLKNAIPADRSKRIRMMAETIEQLADKLKTPEQKAVAERYIRTAEMFYRQYVDEHPSQSLDLVMFFSRQGQTDEALNILEQTWQNSDPIVIAQVCMNLSQNGKAPKEIIERLEKVLANARVKFDDHPAILLSLGDLRVLQDRYTEAETLYRQVLERNPGHAVALNNLAVLLTMQGKKLDEALGLINKAIEISGPLPSMLDTRACVYIAQGNAEKALADMDEAIGAGATPVRLFHQAQALSLANQKYAASSTMQRALAAGLARDMLQTPEKPVFDKLQKLAKELASPQEGK